MPFHPPCRKAAACLLFAVPWTVSAAKKVVTPTANAANDNVEVAATLTLDEAEITQKLGADPGKGIALVEVRLTPKTDKEMRVSPDDFYILSHRDGQRAQPYAPEQLAGKGGLTLSQGAGSGGGLSRTPGRPIGRTPGVGTPQRMPGGGNGIGNSGSAPGEMKTQTNDKEQGNQTLLKAIEGKQLKDTSTTDEVTGYLLFPLEGKQKLKNMAVLYRGPGGRLDLEFQH